MNAKLPTPRTTNLGAAGVAATLLAQLPGIGALGPAAVGELAQRASLCRVRRGESLWRRGGGLRSGLWIVRSGAIWLRAERDGAAVDVVGRGEAVGLCAELEAVVHEDGSLVHIEAADLDAWAVGHAGGVAAVLQLLAATAGRLVHRVRRLTRHGAKVRTAEQLRDLALRFGVRDSRGVIIDLRLTHRELAGLIGATRETVSVAVMELRAAGVVANEGRRWLVVDAPGLAALADA